ncbi:MAG: YccF domain-containing protein [Actinomycetaceae bacterium]|nr:YccF domain-containing protein [Actinomycetaceae bacterium]
MRTILNIIWVVFGGFWLFLEYLFFGIIGCIFIVTIPAGLACFKIAGHVLWPFGRDVVRKPNAGAGSAFANVVWFIVAGLWLAIGHILTAAAQAITIVGIPLALANLKLIPVTCFPFGVEVVSSSNKQPW